ncbi:MAG: flaG [Dehalococcoidia bacterium]|nr:flaG [Dehalococcoidia bacterium]
MVAAVLVIDATYPAVVSSSNSLVRSAQRLDNRIDSEISVVFATGELDEDGAWQDTNGDGHFDVFAWVKNVGSARVLGVDQTDVFLGKAGYFARIPHEDDAGGSYPRWSYTVENSTEWDSTATIQITIHYSSALTSDTYLLRIITPSGAYNEHYFSF